MTMEAGMEAWRFEGQLRNLQYSRQKLGQVKWWNQEWIGRDLREHLRGGIS